MFSRNFSSLTSQLVVILFVQLHASHATVIKELDLLPSDIAAADNSLTTRSYTLTSDSVIVGPSSNVMQFLPRDIEYGSIEIFGSGLLDQSSHYRLIVEVQERRTNLPGSLDINDTTIGVRSGNLGLAVVNSDDINFNGSNVGGLTPIFGCNYTGNNCSRIDQDIVSPLSNMSNYTIVFDLLPDSATATVFDELNASGNSLSHTPNNLALDLSQGLSLSLIGNHEHESYEFLGINIKVVQVPSPSSLCLIWTAISYIYLLGRREKKALST